MKHSHLPRPFIILLFILVGVTSLAGILRSFTTAHAVANATATPAAAAVLKTPVVGSKSETPPSAPTAMRTVQASPTPTFTPTPTLNPELISADTSGIIALAVLMVIVMLVGIVWGTRKPRKKSEPEK